MSPELALVLERERVAELAEAGKLEDAWEIWLRASAKAPDDFRLAPLEVLLSLGRFGVDRCRQRARFWTLRLRRQVSVWDETLDFLELAAEDPLLALAPSLGISVDHARRLRRLFARLANRDVGGVRAVYQLGTDAKAADRHWLVTNSDLEDLETRWHGFFPLSKPLGEERLPRDQTSAWDEEAAEEWIGFLEQHPQLDNSFDVLDDLCLALQQLTGQRAGFELLHRQLMAGPFDRLRRMVRELDDTWGGLRLGWETMSNRSLLRWVEE